MKRRYREEPEEDKELSVITYGRPSLSSWVAAGAMAFAFFILGGFIKTYMQLEELRDESRREIDALHESVERLRAQMAPAGRPRQAAPAYRAVEPMPPARRDRREYWREEEAPPPRETAPSPARGSLRPETAPRQPQYAAPDAYQRFDGEPLQDLLEYPEEAARETPRVQFGRRSNEESRQIIAGSGTPSQVVSVSGVNRRVMIEGGRDVGINEGLRLELCRDGRWIGDLRVLDVFDNQSSCEVLHATLAPLPGDTIRRSQR